MVVKIQWARFHREPLALERLRGLAKPSQGFLSLVPTSPHMLWNSCQGILFQCTDKPLGNKLSILVFALLRIPTEELPQSLRIRFERHDKQTGWNLFGQ